MKYYDELLVSESLLKSLCHSSAEFYKSKFTDINFSNFEFKGTSFLECHFINCNMANLDLTSLSFKQVQFEGCKLVGINWSCAADLMHIEFYNSILDYGTFSNLNLTKSKLINCSIKYCDFSYSNMRESLFLKSNLLDTNFMNSNLASTVFTDAINYFIDVKYTNIKKAKFSFPEVLSLLESYDIEIDGY